MDVKRTLDGISPEQLTGFFVGWPNPPSPQTFMRILAGSSHLALALNGDQVVGFITAISDGVLSAYIPLLEVRPEYQGRGIGQKLVADLLDQLSGLYMIDLTCDENLQPFYERFGLKRATGMLQRNYANQSGSPPTSD